MTDSEPPACARQPLAALCAVVSRTVWEVLCAVAPRTVPARARMSAWAAARRSASSPARKRTSAVDRISVGAVVRIALIALLFGTTTWTTASAAGAVGPLNHGSTASGRTAPSNEMGSGPSPLNQLRESDAALAALVRKRVPSWSPEAGLAQDRLRRLLAGLLDYRKMAERVMGRSWQTMDVAQQNIFVDAFATLTNQAYVSAAARPVGRVRYLSEEVSGTEARVSATAEHSTGEHPTAEHVDPNSEQRLGQIEYRLSRSDDRWLIYDVIVDGVSLTESYQDQLQSVLRREGFDELIARMRRRADARPRD